MSKVKNPERKCRICGNKCEKQMRYCKLCAREVKEIRERRKACTSTPLPFRGGAPQNGNGGIKTEAPQGVSCGNTPHGAPRAVG